MLTLVVGVVGVLAPGGPAGAAPAAAASATTGQRYDAAVHRATDAARTRHDLPATRSAPCLERTAQQQARRMARQGRLSHTRDLGAVLRRCGLSGVGENVAMGYPTGRAVVRAWMGSSGHRANILRPEHRLLGVGVVRARGTWWAVQVFGAR